MPVDAWTSADPYEFFMGRWSRVLAREVVAYLAPAAERRWLDVGCGTGALSEAIVRLTNPRSLIGVDPSEAYVAQARAHITDERASFHVGDATHLPVNDAAVDEVVAGLSLNFVADPVASVVEMRRVLTSGGRATAYVWDYADGMQMLRLFWDAAIAENPSVASMDEGARFPLCQQGALSRCFTTAGITEVTRGEIEIRTLFQNFDDFWDPVLGQQGPAPSYVSSLTDDERFRLRERLRTVLPLGPGGSIDLRARAWVCQGLAS
ncbi:MAG: class I SAM-dependent methyltransferase [Actinomycetes bacterium]